MNHLLHIFEQDKKLMIKVIAGVILLVVAFSFYFIKQISADDDDMALSDIPENRIDRVEETTETAIKESAVVIVDVAGAVANPSVVELPEGSRVYQAIEMAGGLTATADTRRTNQAEILTDGQKLYIPTKQEVEKANNGSAGTSSFFLPYESGTGSSGLININTADAAALQQLT
ncbi:MAG: SLBB domain-containing protein, partial [Bacillota bacterium]